MWRLKNGKWFMLVWVTQIKMITWTLDDLSKESLDKMWSEAEAMK